MLSVKQGGIKYHFYRPIDLVVECLPMARKTGVKSQVDLYQRLKKMELDTSLLNTLHYKVSFFLFMLSRMQCKKYFGVPATIQLLWTSQDELVWPILQI